MTATPVLKKDTRRDLGKRLVNREKAVWEENGWLIDANLRWIWTKAGMRQVTVTDYFGRYDFLAAWPAGGIMALVQVSKTGESHHEAPLGFYGSPVFAHAVDELLGAPLVQKEGYPLPDNSYPFDQGVYEIYVYYRKLKRADNPQAWQADRRWWVAK